LQDAHKVHSTQTLTCTPLAHSYICAAAHISNVTFAYTRMNHRCSKTFHCTQGPDALYDVDFGAKASLQKSIATTPIKYGNMGAGKGRDKALKQDSNLGPGKF